MSPDNPNTLNIGESLQPAAPKRIMDAMAMPIEPAHLKTSREYFILENFIYAKIELLEIDPKRGPYHETFVKFIFPGDAVVKLHEQPAKRYHFFESEEQAMDFLADKCLRCITGLQERYAVLQPPTSIIGTGQISSAEAAQMKQALGRVKRKK